MNVLTIYADQVPPTALRMHVDDFVMVVLGGTPDEAIVLSGTPEQVIAWAEQVADIAKCRRLEDSA
jgi:hypothetical protein